MVSHLSSIDIHMQRSLFPAPEEEIGMLSPKEWQFVRILELMDMHPLLSGQCWCGTGRKPHGRPALAKAFIAKAVWNIPTTRGLIDRIKSSPSLRRLCGWNYACDIPHESAFSRAFELFALRELPANIHRSLVKDHLGESMQKR